MNAATAAQVVTYFRVCDGVRVSLLGELLPTIETATQIVSGRNDDLVPWSNNQYLDDLLPHSETHPLDAGHFAWEQAAEEYGRLVAGWVSGGYRRVAAA